VIYAEVLAGGKGTRMGNINMPKQFLTLQGKPIVVHTVEKFLLNSRLDKILVVSPREWIHHTKDILAKWIGQDSRLVVVEGGQDRNESIMSGIRYIEEEFGIDEEDVIITHDSVRPFVTHRIVEENIDAVLQYGAVDTAVPAVDTIIESDESQNFIDTVPVRQKMFQGQTPQSFNIKKLVEHYQALNAEQKAVLTDACKIFSISGSQVRIVRGEYFNIKITTPHDLKIAEALFDEKKVGQ
jgi:2-C-methyl-D-erythritol 4-phosphate cytidylyltransferase